MERHIVRIQRFSKSSKCGGNVALLASFTTLLSLSAVLLNGVRNSKINQSYNTSQQTA
jgi:hypothetical protein